MTHLAKTQTSVFWVLVGGRMITYLWSHGPINSGMFIASNAYRNAKHRSKSVVKFVRESCSIISDDSRHTPLKLLQIFSALAVYYQCWDKRSTTIFFCAEQMAKNLLVPVVLYSCLNRFRDPTYIHKLIGKRIGHTVPPCLTIGLGKLATGISRSVVTVVMS